MLEEARYNLPYLLRLYTIRNPTSHVEEKLEGLRQLVECADKIVVLTGAGISCASGIPDFRSDAGLWSAFDFREIGTYGAFLKNPEKFWAFERAMLARYSNTLPNPAHKAIARLAQTGKVTAILTQNVDSLHQKAQLRGVKTPIIGIHGSPYEIKCLSCSKRVSRTEFEARLDSNGFASCPICGGLLKSSVVLFNEPLNDEFLEESHRYLAECDLLLIVGASLQVYPVNSFPQIARQNGARIAYLNKTQAKAHAMADIFIQGAAETILPKIVENI